ncbi:MAG: Ada metal-binding domain-containing protein, partial [Verrucomicrobiota bacterium]
MKTLLTIQSKKRVQRKFLTDSERWKAVIGRDATADGKFYYSVRTTKVYCRPSCAARLANWDNVEFHDSWEVAECAGFRACKRCRPKDRALEEEYGAIVLAACRSVETSEESPSLALM